MQKLPDEFNLTKSHENATKPKLGDYVTADLVEKTVTEDHPEGLHEPRQGVFVKDNGDGSILLEGESEQYVCKGPNEVAVVPDENLTSDARAFVIEERKKLGL